MIRAAALLCLLALPAAAQDFRGLMPGDPASDLARLGEPLSINDDGSIGRRSTYPLPFNQRLRVEQDGDRILALASWPDPLNLPPDGRPGFQAFVTTLGDATLAAGSEGWYFELEGQATILPPSSHWRLYYDLPAHPNVVLSLVFSAIGHTGAPNADGQLRLPESALLLQAELYHRDYIAAHPDRFGTARIARPGAAPIALPLSEVFPLTELPH